MNINTINEQYDFSRKFKEYEMKIIKMAGYLTDYYIDRAMESEDFSEVSGFLIDYFSGPAGKSFDVGYLVSKYREYGLNEKIEDIDFNIDDWYKIKYELSKKDPYDVDPEWSKVYKMPEDEYIQYMIEKRKKEMES